MDGNIQRMTELAGILQGDEKYVRLSGISGSRIQRITIDPQASGGINQAVEISGCPSEVFYPVQ